MRVYDAPWSKTTGPVPQTSAIHGSFSLPLDGGYKFVLVPNDIDLDLPVDANDARSEIACNYNALKGLVALGQSIFALTTLYKTRGDQIAQYGYAAFGLTVAPYAIMSLINLIGGMVTPQYPCFYMVGSSIMDEAQRRPGCYFQGTVGRLGDTENEPPQQIETFKEKLRLSNKPVLFEQVNDITLRARVYLSDNNYRYNPLSFWKPALSKDHTTDIEMSSIEPLEESVVLEIEYEHQHQQTAAEAGLLLQPQQNHENQSETYLFVPNSSRTRLHGYARRPPRVWFNVENQTHFAENTTARLFFNLGDDLHSFFTYILAAFLGFVPLAMIGGLSKFRNGGSTAAQRGWTMSWWVFGFLYGNAPVWNSFAVDKVSLNRPTLAILSVPAIGGFVVVGQMLASYGTCVRIS